SLEAAKLQRLLGRAKESRASIERALRLANELAREEPDNLSRRLLHADVLAALGAYYETGARSLRLQEQAAGELEGAMQTWPEHRGLALQLVQTHGTLAAAYVLHGRPAAAVRCQLRALELLGELIGAEPEALEHRTQRGLSRVNLAMAYFGV